MNRKTSAIIVIFLIFISAFSAHAQQTADNIKGLWAGAFEADDVFAALGIDFDQAKVVLKFAGNEQTGAIKELKIDGNAISFLAESRPRAKFTGTIDGERISGTFDILRSEGGRSNPSAWNVRRVASLDFKTENKSSVSDVKLELPAPTGKLNIGRRFFYWTDETRAETITDDARDRRKLFVQIWYPAETNKKNRRSATTEYRPNAKELGLEKDSDAKAAVKLHAVQDAPLLKSKKKFPVVIFSPGLGASPFNYAAIIENLVSRGYAVAAVNHAYDSGDFVFSDGSIIRFDAEKWERPISDQWTSEQRRQFFDERRLVWAKDFSFVADRLQALEKPFAAALDMENLGLFGHSFGGQAASIACAADARFKACANLDGMAQGSVVLPDGNGKYLKQPFLFFNKASEATDAELKMMNLTREEYRVRERERLVKRWQPSFKKRLAEIDAGAYFVLYPGINHGSFSDNLLLNTAPNDPLFARRFEIARNINDYITAFFDKFLKNSPAPLLDEKSDSRPPVIVEFLRKK